MGPDSVHDCYVDRRLFLPLEGSQDHRKGTLLALELCEQGMGGN